ncbi:MAG TPA: FGGY family carbohydrate kinase [Gammaproteobacteria bacterium]|nr:FGGY family carbohydrate kinase [Gammaproteobacteria bacterium]
MSALTLAIDQGTHSTRAIVFDAQGRVVAQARQAVALQVRSHSEAEQNPDEILASLHRVVKQVLVDPALTGRPVGCAGLATQRSSVVAWDCSTGQALSPVLSWQDRRTAPWIATLASHEKRIAQLTGLRLSPHYGAGKLRWLFDTVPAVAEAARTGRLLMGPLASYLLFHLLQDRPACVDHANASRTLLWNLHTRDWDDELLELFGIPRPVLPACRPVCADYGRTTPGDIPLRAVNGDQTAALYALGAPRDDTILVNIGTGAFVLLPVADPATRPTGLLAGISHSDAGGGRYYIEGTVNGAAAALTWAAQRFALTGLEEKLPGWLNDITEPALFINTVGGLGAPWWRTGPEPYFESSKLSAAEAMVAVIESILFLIQANIGLMRQAAPCVGTIRISGGLSNLDALCQRLADLSGLEVQRPPQVEATARGIAWQASGASAAWPASGPVARFTPRANPGLQARYERFVGVLHTLR